MIETRVYDTEKVCSYDVDEFVRDFIARLPLLSGNLQVTLVFLPAAEVPS